jgi:hypothetical protein
MSLVNKTIIFQVKLGYNELLETGQIFRYIRVNLYTKSSFGTVIFVRYIQVRHDITEFVII